jgi:hypothetical protein
VVVSSRLHASILALCGGTPVITLEPSVFKLTAIFQPLNYPIPTDTITREGWAQRVAQHVDLALNRRDELSAYTGPALTRQVGQIYKSYRPMFSPSAAVSAGPVAAQS